MAIYVYEEKRHMKFNSGIAMAIVLSFAVAGLTACEKGPAERAGGKIDDTVKKVGEKIENAGEKIKDTAKK
jgi:predicted small secreted protein